MQDVRLILTMLCVSPLVVSTAYATDNFYNTQLGDSEISLSPGADLSLKYDDNIFLQESGPAKKSSWITEINPYLSFNTHRGLDTYEFRYTLNAGFVHSSHDDDYLDHVFEINTHNEPNKKNRFDLHASYNMLHEDRGTGISDGTSIFFNSPDEYTDILLNGKYTYGARGAMMNLEFEAGYLDEEYTNHRSVTKYFDYSEPRVGATFYYRIMPKTRLLFQARYEDISYDKSRPNSDRLDSKEQNYQLGITWEATAKTTGLVKVGYLDKDFDSDSYKDDSFTSWEIGINWSPRDTTTFNVMSSSDAIESKGAGTFNEAQNYLASWMQDWNSKIQSTLILSREDSDYAESTREDTVDSVEVRADYKFTPEIKLGVSYNYSDRDSTQIGSNYNNNIFMLYVSIGL